jgi:cell division protein FtsB
MHEQIKTHKHKVLAYLHSLRDIRALGLLVFVCVLLLMTWSGIKVVERNYGLQKQINELQQQVELAKLENDTLRLGNEYYQTNTYLELSARQNFGLANPGETQVVIPKNVALGKLVAEPTKKTATQAASEGSFMSKNFRAWVNFFLHREQVIEAE